MIVLFCIDIFNARVPAWNIYGEIKSTGKISNDFANEYRSSIEKAASSQEGINSRNYGMTIIALALGRRAKRPKVL